MAVTPDHSQSAGPRLVDRWVLTGTSPCACIRGRAAR
jgi:hypothetical protein